MILKNIICTRSNSHEELEITWKLRLLCAYRSPGPLSLAMTTAGILYIYRINLPNFPFLRKVKYLKNDWDLPYTYKSSFVLLCYNFLHTYSISLEHVFRGRLTSNNSFSPLEITPPFENYSIIFVIPQLQPMIR